MPTCRTIRPISRACWPNWTKATTSSPAGGKNRQDATIRRNFVSRVANKLISRLSGVRLHDYGCSLKAYRRSVLAPVRLYGEMHRFVPIYASWYGARITEIPVNHNPRLHGKSNYGLERILKVMLDLMVVRFLDRWIGKPIYIFGGFGMLWFAVAAISAAYMLYLKFFGYADDDPDAAAAAGGHVVHDGRS